MLSRPSRKIISYLHVAGVLLPLIEHSIVDYQEWSKLLEKRHELKSEKQTNAKKHMVYKIFNQYNNGNIKNIISKLVDRILLPILQNLLEMLEKLRKMSQHYVKFNKTPYDKLLKHSDGNYHYGIDEYVLRSLSTELCIHTGKCFDQIVTFMSRLTDLFFLRRFLDKDYVTNGVVYSGINHSIFYIFILIKYFGFTVTHTSYSNIQEIDKLNNHIKNTSNYYELQKVFYPSVLTQCVHTNDFPKWFQ